MAIKSTKKWRNKKGYFVHLSYILQWFIKRSCYQLTILNFKSITYNVEGKNAYKTASAELPAGKTDMSLHLKVNRNTIKNLYFNQPK